MIFFRSKTSKILSVWRNPSTEIYIDVQTWYWTLPVNDQYIVRPFSLNLVFNYIKKVGFISVFQKIHSRLSEGERNKKFFGVGYGIVREFPLGSIFTKGMPVLFFAPNHSRRALIIAINCELAIPLVNSADGNETFVNSNDLYVMMSAYRGWTSFSGFEIDFLHVQKLLRIFREHFLDQAPKIGETADFVGTIDHIENAPLPSHKPTAVLFGLGNYAKTAIIPNIAPFVSLKRVHEVDPDQLKFLINKSSISLDTSPIPRPALLFDAWFIAGFHHTHSDLAVAALEQSAYAVIEKPLATNRSQFDFFVKTASKGLASRFFLCFHKRYSELHQYALLDLPTYLDLPVDMHCIVYEIPLPELHWYNWPNSGSRLISNGCHWIDYFMFINNYSPEVEYRVWRPRSQDVIVQIRLQNGAYFSMTLTDVGSSRLGVRDYIELRSGDVTVKIIDGAQYQAENSNRIFRKATVNPGNAYIRMYREIGMKIAAKSSGDDLISLRSSQLTITLEEMLIDEVSGQY